MFTEREATFGCFGSLRSCVLLCIILKKFVFGDCVRLSIDFLILILSYWAIIVIFYPLNLIIALTETFLNFYIAIYKLFNVY